MANKLEPGLPQGLCAVRHALTYIGSVWHTSIVFTVLSDGCTAVHGSNSTCNVTVQQLVAAVQVGCSHHDPSRAYRGSALNRAGHIAGPACGKQNWLSE